MRIRQLFAFQESGLVLVVMVLALVFTLGSGKGQYPVLERGPDGEMTRVYETTAQGEQVPKMVTEYKFLRVQNLTDIAKSTSFIAIMAIGMAVVIISGGIDLSVGAIYALASVLGALVLHAYGPRAPENYSPWFLAMLGFAISLPLGAVAGIFLGHLRKRLSTDGELAASQRSVLLALALAAGVVIGVGGNYFLAHYGPGSESAKSSPWIGVGLGAYACLATGFLCGLGNGGLIVALRMHPFIITLGTMAIFRGVAFIAAEGQSIGFFPPQLQQTVKYEVGAGLTLVPLIVMLAVTLVGWIYLSRLAAGRRVYAIGGNELAAQYSGIEVPRVKLGAYLWSGTTAGLAALMSIGFYGAGSSGDGQGYELSVIAAAVVGGASLTGGRGTALGAMLGALIIQEIATGIVFVGIDQNYSQIITGAVVVIAVTLDKLNTWLTQRRLSRKVA